MSMLPKAFISEEQYLQLNRAAEYRSEYYDGEMFAMPGTSIAHSQIVFDTGVTLHSQLRGRAGEAFLVNMRTRIGSAARYAYTAIPSLEQYVLIATGLSIEVFTRQPDGLWSQAKATQIDDTIALESIGCRLALCAVYDRVELPAAEASA